MTSHPTREKSDTEMQDLTRLKRATSEEAGDRNELAWLLVLDNLVYAGDTESRWLDRVGSRLARGAICPPELRTHRAGSPNRGSAKGLSR